MFSHRAVKWTNGSIEAISSTPNSSARGISADGTVIAGSVNSEATLWTNGVAQGLGDLPGGQLAGVARAISADNMVAVGSSIGASGEEAFRWTSASGMIPLGDLSGGDHFSVATAVSGDGSVVVGYSSVAGSLEAFIWDAPHGMRSLRDVLVEANVDVTGWSIRTANGISADGNTIVGQGIGPARRVRRVRRDAARAGRVACGRRPYRGDGAAAGKAINVATAFFRRAGVHDSFPPPRSAHATCETPAPSASTLAAGDPLLGVECGKGGEPLASKILRPSGDCASQPGSRSAADAFLEPTDIPWYNSPTAPAGSGAS